MNSTLRQGIRLCACPMRRLLTATLLLLLLLPAAHAFAGDNPSDLLIDACRDEKVDGTYSQKTYRRALDQLPADSDQYTACRDVINRARLAALNSRRSSSGNGGGGGQGGSSGGGSGGGGSNSGAGSSGGSSRSSSAPAAGRRTPRPRPRRPPSSRPCERRSRPGPSPVNVGGQLVQPGAVGALASDAPHDPHVPPRPPRRPRGVCARRDRRGRLAPCPRTPRRLIPAPWRGASRCRASAPARRRRSRSARSSPPSPWRARAGCSSAR